MNPHGRPKRDELISILWIACHQYLPLTRGKKIIVAKSEKYIANIGHLLFPAFIILYILHFHFNDREKQPQELFFKYRYGMAFFISLLWLANIVFKNKSWIINTAHIVLAYALSLVQAWSMTLGYVRSPKWVITLPLFVFVATSNSFFASLFHLCVLAALSKALFVHKDDVRFLFSDLTVGVVLLAVSQIVRRIWNISVEKQYLYEEASQQLIEQQLEYSKIIKSFISPGLVSKIEEKVNSGVSIVAAADEVLRRKKSIVAVVFSDLRSFSERSHNIEFVEKELIPASAVIINEMESNGGIAKQIGDAIFSYYDQADPEVALLKAIRDSLVCSAYEISRVKALNRASLERHFSVSYGSAMIGDMASEIHHEPTVIGYPANLAARLDSLTKFPEIKAQFDTYIKPKIILSYDAGNLLSTFSKWFELEKIDLKNTQYQLKSYPNESSAYLFALNDNNAELFTKVLSVNKLLPLNLERYGC